jgi:hypothetical protein
MHHLIYDFKILYFPKDCTYGSNMFISINTDHFSNRLIFVMQTQWVGTEFLNII